VLEVQQCFFAFVLEVQQCFFAFVLVKLAYPPMVCQHDIIFKKLQVKYRNLLWFVVTTWSILLFDKSTCIFISCCILEICPACIQLRRSQTL
jgi:hypothetical protein